MAKSFATTESWRTESFGIVAAVYDRRGGVEVSVDRFVVVAFWNDFAVHDSVYHDTVDLSRQS
jgi:hypothetical protein